MKIGQNRFRYSLNIQGESVDFGGRHSQFDFVTSYSEFLIHAADVEGLCQGIDEQLVESTSSFPFLPAPSCFSQLIAMTIFRAR